jgi:hypothetical protein
MSQCAIGAAGFWGVAEAQVSTPVYRANALVESIGICTHLSYSGTVYVNKFDKIFPLLVDSGIKHFREEVIVKLNLAYNNPFYVRCRSFVDKGVKFCCIAAKISKTPSEQDFDGLEKAYDNMGGGIEIYEGINEPNYSGIPDWPAISASMQEYLYKAVRKIPKLDSVPVLSPSFTGSSGRTVGDISAYADYGNIHSYSGGNYPETTGTGNLSSYTTPARTNTLEKPIISTESGYHSAMLTTKPHAPVPVPIIARYLPRLLLFNFMSGIKRSYIYEFADSHNLDDADQESRFGLVDMNGVPKASYYAVKNLIGMFSGDGAEYPLKPLDISISGNSSKVLFAVFQKADGEYLVPVWLAVPAYNPTTRTVLPVPAQTVRLTTGNAMTLVDVRKLQDTGEIELKDHNTTDVAFEVSIDSSVSVFRFRR